MRAKKIQLKYKKINKENIKKFKKIIYTPQNSGFFSNFNNIVSCLMNKEKKDVLKVDLSTKYLKKEKGFNYSGGDRELNIWEVFFQPLKMKKYKNVIYKKVIYTNDYRYNSKNSLIMGQDLHNRKKYGLNFGEFVYYKIWKQQHLWRNKANGLIDKYIKLKPYMLEKIDTFFKQNMSGNNVIGVHVRHPHIKVEQPRKKVPTYKDYVTHIKNNYDYKNSIIFLATDHNPPIKIFQQEFGSNLVYQKDVGRINQTKCLREMHERTSRLSMAEDVISDCYLMSKCDSLVHIISNVALAAACINKNLKSDLICII